MMKKLLIAATALGGMAATPAMAETLNVAGVVAPYCNISLNNVSSGTLSIAEPGQQIIANLTLKCNGAGGTKLVVNPANGDLTRMQGNTTLRINYAMELESPDPDFAIANTDTTPGDTVGGFQPGIFNLANNTYKQTIANGIALVLKMDTNVAVDPNQPQGSLNFPANAAPAGLYEESFSFTASAI